MALSGIIIFGVPLVIGAVNTMESSALSCSPVCSPELLCSPLGLATCAARDGVCVICQGGAHWGSGRGGEHARASAL